MTNFASQEDSSADNNSASRDPKQPESEQQHLLRKAARQLIAGGCAGVQICKTQRSWV